LKQLDLSAHFFFLSAGLPETSGAYPGSGT
jgi:hypothetical protein